MSKSDDNSGRWLPLPVDYLSADGEVGGVEYPTGTALHTSSVSCTEHTVRFDPDPEIDAVADREHLFPIRDENQDAICTACGHLIVVDRGDKTTEYGHLRTDGSGPVDSLRCPHRPESVDP